MTPCPRCGATLGQPCRNDAGEPLEARGKPLVHLARILPMGDPR